MTSALMRILTREGVIDVPVGAGTGDASTVGTYWNAVQQFLASGDESALKTFDGVSVAGHRLETDASWIEYWAESGQLDFEEIYGIR